MPPRLFTIRKSNVTMQRKSIAQRRGNRIAAIALARRLAGVLWAMWHDGTVYEPRLVGNASATGLERQSQTTQVVAAAVKRASSKTERRLRPARKLVSMG